MKQIYKKWWFWAIIAVIVLVWIYRKNIFNPEGKMCCGGIVTPPSLKRMANGNLPGCICKDGTESYYKPGTADCDCPENKI